jgi:hypothetical protein
MIGDHLLRNGVAALKAGRRAEAYALLLELIEQDEANEMAWLWMARCVVDRDAKRKCFERALRINPDNQRAVQGLKRLDAQSATLPKRDRLGANRIGLTVGAAAGGVLIVLAVVSIWVVISGKLRGSAPPATVAALITHVPFAQDTGETATTAPAAVAIGQPTSAATVVQTWTPAATRTPQPTNTRLPTRSPRPTYTPWPTRTRKPVVRLVAAKDRPTLIYFSRDT